MFLHSANKFPLKYEVKAPDCVWSLSASDADSGESSLLIHLPKAKRSMGFGKNSLKVTLEKSMLLNLGWHRGKIRTKRRQRRWKIQKC